MRRFGVFALVLFTLVAGSLVDTSPVLLPGFAVETVASGLTLPVGFVELPGGRILIAEKNGLVRLFKNGAIQATPFIDLRAKVNSYWDHGMLGIAADANFAANGFVYLLYVYEHNAANAAGPKTSRLVRVTATGDIASPATEVVLLGSVSGNGCAVVTADCIPAEEPSHSVGSVRVASDGTLFVSTGDGASFTVVDDRALRAQNPDSLAGKLLHVTTTGLGLSSNQWWNGTASANRSKVAAMGFRNPYRFSLRPGTDVPYIGDVGWGNFEEINVGFGNFGWPCYEGPGQQSGYQTKPTCQALYAQGPSAVRAPLVAYPHGAASSAVVGGAFYTGTTYPAAYQGAYFFGDYALSVLRYLRVDGADQLQGTDALFATDADSPVDLQMGSDGNLYYVSITAGELRRVTYSPTQIPTETPLSDLSWTSATNGWGPVERDRSNGQTGAADGGTITLNGVTYAKGLGVHAPSDVRYQLGGLCTTFSTDIGVDDEVGPNGSVVFQIWADGVRLYDSGTMTGTTATLHANVDLSGRQELALVVTAAGDGVNSDHGDWAGATLSCVSGSGPPPPPPNDTVYVSDLVWTSETNGWGPLERDFSNGSTGTGDGGTITLNGTAYLKGVGAHAAADLSVAIPPLCTGFRATVGVDDAVGSAGSITFGVSADGTSLFQSATLTGSSPAVDIYVSVSGRAELRLVVGNGGDGIDSDHGDWANARFTGCAGGTGNLPPTMTISNPTGSVPFKVGDVIGFQGSATDPEDGTLPASGVAWQVVLHHCVGASCHEHFLTTGTGLSGSFTAPDHADDFQIEIRMTATDSGGLTDMASVMLSPQTVAVTLSASPAGLQVVFNGTSTPAPATYAVVVGAVRTISTVSPQGGNVFQSWSDGGALQHQITVGATAATYVATFSATDTTPPVISAVSATAISSTGATINWTTNEPADGQVEYGLTTAYGTTTTLQSALTTAHQVALSGLTSGTLYHYRVRSRDASGNLAVSGDNTFTTAAGGGTVTRYVSDLTWVSSTNGWGPIERDRSNGENGASDGATITLNGTTYVKGLGTHAASDLRVAIPSGCTAFLAAVGVDDEVGAGGSVTFTVSADGVSLFQSATLTGSSASAAVNVSVVGRAQLRLVVGNGGNDISFDHADWANARFTGCSGATDTTPPVISGISATGITNATATINWTTNEPADGQVEYGLTTAYGTTTTLQSALTTAHQVALSGLTSGTLYHYRVRSRDAAGNLGVSTDQTFTTSVVSSTRYVSDLTWVSSTNGWGPIERDRSNGENGASDGATITLNGMTYVKGLGTHAASDLRVAIPTGCTAFLATVGVDDEVGAGGSVTFTVSADGVSLFQSATLTGASASAAVNVSVVGRAQLRLVVGNGGNDISFDHADWADARFTGCN